MLRRISRLQGLDRRAIGEHPLLVLRIPCGAGRADAARGVAFFIALDRHKFSGGVERWIKASGLNERATPIASQWNWKLTDGVVLQAAVIAHQARRKIWKNEFLIHKLQTLKRAGGK